MQKNSYWDNFTSEHKNDWHFDPSIKSQDYEYVGRLKTNFKPLLDLMNDDNTDNNSQRVRGGIFAQADINLLKKIKHNN